LHYDKRLTAMPDFSATSGSVLAFLIASALLAGLARGFSGFGAALIFMPLASATVGPKVAAPLLLLIDMATTFTLIPNAWRGSNRRDVGTMALGALAGVPAGAYALSRVDPITIRWGVAVLIAAVLVLLMSGWRYRNKPAPPLTVGIGALSGFLGGVAQISGPPVIAYWLGGATAAHTLRANFILYFATTSALATAMYFVNGLWTAAIAPLALAAAPAYAAGVFTGTRMFSLASERTFRAICYALIALAGLVSLPVLDGVLR
jgi:uncharacterized membrane protein YfcA